MKCLEKVLSEIALLSLTVAFIILTCATTGATAEKYPSKEISIIVPYAAGSTTDLSARVFAEYFRKEIGVPVIVDVRPESGGITRQNLTVTRSWQRYCLVNLILKLLCALPSKSWISPISQVPISITRLLP